MKKSIHGLLCFLSIAVLFSACQKKDWDEYYGRPADLAPPIYQQLQARGNFTNLLAVIDKSGYKDILGKSGSWTLFAPNDAAFQKYFQENGISGADAIDAVTARKIATYNLVYNPYRKDQLSFYQTSAGPDTNAAFRRKTAYYDFVYTENGKKVVNNGRHGVLYVPNENNNKHIPYFIDSYFTKNGLSPSDYTDFFPNQTFNGFNVAGAKVVTADIPAENGIIHEVDQVITPLPNIEQYIASKPEYSEFKKLLDKYVIYTPNADFTKRYQALTGSTDSVFLKSYSGLAFSPNVEGYAGGNTDGQKNSFSIAVPTNTALKAYTDVILEHYGTFEAAPPSVLANFINSHMWIAPVWPSLLSNESNVQMEQATFNASNLLDKKILSNANFMGLNKAQEANVFRTIFGRAYLNPQYLSMTRAITSSDVFNFVTAPTVKATMFLIPNATITDLGYEFNSDNQTWGYGAPGLPKVYDAAATTRINRLIQTSILNTANGELDNINGEGVVEAYNGEYIKYSNGKLYASGNVVSNEPVTITGTKTSVNGKVYTTSGTLKFAEDNINMGWSLEKLATSTDLQVRSRYSHFFDYLKNSSMWTAATKAIAGVDAGAFYTLLVPTNAAIEEAVKAGRLPGNTTTGVPNFNAGTQTAAQKDAVERMIAYSIISKSTIAVDGKKTGNFVTTLKNSVGDSRLLRIRYTNANNPATMEVLDDTAVPNVATVNLAYSNNLGNRLLIHSINKVLKF